MSEVHFIVAGSFQQAKEFARRREFEPQSPLGWRSLVTGVEYRYVTRDCEFRGKKGVPTVWMVGEYWLSPIFHHTLQWAEFGFVKLEYDGAIR